MSVADTASQGAVEIGCVLASCLFGIVLSQSYDYYKSQNEQCIQRDNVKLRLFVASIVVIDVIHTISMWIYFYGVSIINPADILVRAGAPELGAFVTLLSMELLSSSLVQLFFTHRVYMLSRRLVLAILGWAGVGAKIARGIALMVLSGQRIYPRIFQNPLLVLAPTFTLVALAEVFNTVALCVVLRSKRSQVKSTRRILDKLMLWSIQTGLLISICSIAIVLLLALSPRTDIWIAPFLMLPKLFSLSLLTTLNSRAHIRRAMDTAPVTFSILDPGPVTGSVPTGPPILLELPDRGNAAGKDERAKVPPEDLENSYGLGQQH